MDWPLPAVVLAGRIVGRVKDKQPYWNKGVVVVAQMSEIC